MTADEEIIFRKATARDLNDLLDFEQKIILAEQPFDSTLKKDATNYYNLKEIVEADNSEIVVAECRGRLIASGFVCIVNSEEFLTHSHHGFMGFMYTVPGHRGKGINLTIVERLINWASTKGIREFRLEVYVKNISAMKAYEKAGFSKHLIEMRKRI